MVTPVSPSLAGCGPERSGGAPGSGGPAGSSVNAVAAEGEVAATETIQPLRWAGDRASLLAALDRLARRGKLAGYSVEGLCEGVAFTVSAHGAPFDGLLEARALQEAGAGASGIRLIFAPRVKPTAVWIAGVVLALTVWPGVVLTESLIASMFPGSSAWTYTWYWYIPMTAPFAPLALWQAIKRSRASITAAGREVVERLRSDLASEGAKPS